MGAGFDFSLILRDQKTDFRQVMHLPGTVRFDVYCVPDVTTTTLTLQGNHHDVVDVLAHFEGFALVAFLTS